MDINIRDAWRVLTGTKQVSEAIFPVSAGADPDEHLWEKFGDRRGLNRHRNLPPMDQQQMIRNSHYFYKGNPIAKRLTQIAAEYVIGDGLHYTAQNDGVREILDAHWTDPTNNWQIYQYERVRDWGLFGEMCIPAFVNPMNGFVTLGNIDTELIERVVPDPDNTMKSYAIILKKLRGESHRRVYKIIDVANVPMGGDAFGRWVGLPESKEEKELYGFPFMRGDKVNAESLKAGIRYTNMVWEGSCFFFTLNNPLTADRGWSDLLDSTDWIDAHDQYLFSTVEKAIMSANYVEDITLTGKDETQIRQWLNAQPRSKPGKRFAHNENIAMKIETPDLHLEDASSLANVLKNHILAGSGMPPIWFAESLVSRASAPEMTEPTFKHLKMRQRYTAHFIGRVFRFQLDQSILKGRLRLDRRQNNETQSREESASFFLTLPEVSMKDQRMLAIALRNTAGALKEVVEGELVSKEMAREIFTEFVRLMGLGTWKEQPRYGRGEDREPDDNFSPEKIFKRAQESGEFEVRNERGNIYVFLESKSTRESSSVNVNGKSGKITSLGVLTDK